MSPWLFPRLLSGLAGLSLTVSLGACHRTDPDALWQIVHGNCVPDEVQRHDPAPCAVVELASGEASGYAVLKDMHGPYQFLLIPTARITGIESAALLASASPNYFAAAWRERTVMEQAVGHPLARDTISLAVNSRFGRSQNQLHIHIDCLRPEVRAALHDHMTAIGASWGEFPVALMGHHYRVRRVRGEDLDGNDPFRLLAESGPDVAAQMERHTLVVAAVAFDDGAPGFVLMDDRATLWPFDRAHGEELQDHQCR